MASLITHTLGPYSREDIYEYVIKPLFVDNDIKSLVTIRTGIKTSEKLDYFDKLEKITKAYARGTSFTAASGVTMTQKTISVNDMKAQIEQNAKEFEDSIKQELLASGWKLDDINQADQILRQVVLTIFMKGLAADLQRQLWFGDTKKENRTSDIPIGTADLDYNVYDGFWEILRDDVNDSTIPDAQYLNLNSTTYLDAAGVAQVYTNTISGVAGTVKITINGTLYTEAFLTDLTTTAANFVTSHAATILAREGDNVLTSSGADIILTAGIPGFAFTAVGSSDGGITDSEVATTANVLMGAIKTNGTLAAFRAMWGKLTPVLKKAKGEAKFMVTSSVLDNYMTTLESGAHDGAQKKLVDGVETYYFRGIEVIEMIDWDVRIAADIDYYPHRILLATPKNLIVGVDESADEMDVEEWYNEDEQLRKWRTQYKTGVEYVHPDYIVLGY
jgi:hypothetical protein